MYGTLHAGSGSGLNESGYETHVFSLAKFATESQLMVILCVQVAAELALCRECKAVSTAEREELVLKVGGYLTCSYQHLNWTKKRATKV